MTIDYAAMNKSVRKHKAALTRAKNSGDPQKVIAAVNAAFTEWGQPGMAYPDQWHTWDVAKYDAEMALRRAA